MNSLVSVVRRVFHSSVERLIQVASIFALTGLGVFALGLIYPKPLLVVLSMSLGHVLGGVAFALYLLAIVFDATLSPRTRAPEIPQESPSLPDARVENARDPQSRR
jgi:hypothetical protein